MPINNNTYNPTTYNSTSTPKNYKRGNPIPLDNTALWNSLDDAKAYAEDNATAYVGQIISVVENNKEAAYIITETMQEDGSYLRPIADLSKIEQDIADLKELPEHKEVKMANEVGDSKTDSYGIKRTESGLELKSYEDEILTKITIGKNGIPIEQRHSVIKSTIYPVGEKFSTIVTDPENVFQSVDEIKADVENGGQKFQRLWEEGRLAAGYEGYYCNEITHRAGNDLFIILDEAGDGFVGLEAGTSISDITYTENVMKIVKIGDFYLYIVYDENHRPIGACKIGRPKGYFPEGDKNYNAEFIFTELYDDNVDGGDGKLDSSKSIYEAINTFPATRAPRDKVPFVNVDGTSITGEITGTSAWGTPVHMFQIIIVNDRYYFVYSRRNQEPVGWCCPKVTNGSFQLHTSKESWDTKTEYQFSDDFFTIKQVQETSTSTEINNIELLNTLMGKGNLISNVDEYGIPGTNVNLWGGYWPEKGDYRVGVFGQDFTNYTLTNISGANTAIDLNPAGNYSIGKLESFHPLRLEDGSELKIRTATIKGIKTNMDWPNCTAVIPADCSLKTSAIWVQYILAYPVGETFPRLFYRVLYDGYVIGTTNTRYPWTSCREITPNTALANAKKYTDEAITQAISELEIPEMPEVIYTEIQQADTDTLGGIKIGYEQNDKNYPVKLDDTGKAFVEVPWTDTNTTDLTGDGSALTNLDANNITTGIIDEERLPKKYMTELQIEFEGATLTSYTLSKAVASIRFISDTQFTTAQNGDLSAAKFGEYLAKACYVNGALKFSAVGTGTASNYCAIPYTIQISEGSIIYKGTVIEYTSNSTGTNTVTNYVMDLSIDPGTIKYTVISSIEI